MHKERKIYTFGLFSRKTKYTKTIIATSDEVKQRAITEREFLKEANTCPECGFEANRPMIRTEGDGKKYKVPVSCSSCGCKFEYERPYEF